MADFLEPALGLDAVAERFTQYARIECGQYPLYESLALAISTDREILALAAAASPGQPLPVLFFGAVHHLLLASPSEPLARFYRNMNAQAPSPALEDPYPTFRDFCLRHAEDIVLRVRTRRVQTNEVARCACFLPALSFVTDRGPLAWIEAGASAGLNLNWPRYQYAYSDGRTMGPADASVRIRCDVQGAVPLPARFPEIGFSAGLDLDPPQVDDADAARWLQALVWPDQVERFDRLRAALALRREHAVDVRPGDVFDLLPILVRQAPSALHVCVVHSYMMNQMSHAQRLQLEGMFEDLSRLRPITRIFIEWLDGGPWPLLELHEYVDGRRAPETALHPSRGVLATCHWHGLWLRWA